MEYVIFTLKGHEGETVELFKAQTNQIIQSPLTKDDYSKLAELFIQAITNSNVRNKIYFVNENQKTNEKFIKAIESYASIKKDEYPIILFDNTSLGGAKDGFLITNKNIYGHSIWQSPIRVSIADIKNIKISGSDLYINNQKVDIVLIESGSRKYFEEFLKGVLFALQELLNDSQFNQMLINNPASILTAYRKTQNLNIEESRTENEKDGNKNIEDEESAEGEEIFEVTCPLCQQNFETTRGEVNNYDQFKCPYCDGILNIEFEDK